MTSIPLDLETRVVRKMQLRILPFAMLLYFVSFLDRVNVGFAALSMNKTIGLTAAMFGLGGGIFFVGYFLFEVPSNLILYRVGARLWIARVMVTWGLVSAACAFVTGPHSFYILRFLLGAAEAGFFPGIILYLSLWFPKQHRAVAAAAFMAAVPLSTVVGSPISGALMQLPPFGGLSNWQWLFIIEAVPAILLGLLVLKVLTDRPEEATWLKPDEREWLVSTLHAERSDSTSKGGHTTGVWAALCDIRVLALSMIYLGTSAGTYTLGLWAPLILSQFGFSSLATGWIISMPGIVAIAGMIAWARHSDRTQERTWHVVIAYSVASLGFIWAGTTHSAIGVILALVVMNLGISAGKAPLWAMPSMFLSGASAAAGIALINSIGNLGGFIGPFLIGWLKDRWGSYSGGLYAVAMIQGMSCVVMLLLARQISPKHTPPAA